MKKSVAKGKHLFALLLETYSPFTGPQFGVPFLLCQALETLIHEYVQTHLYQDAQIAELLEALRHKFDGLLNPAPQPPDADDHLSSDSGSEDQPADEPLQAAGPTPVEELENEFAETDAVELTTEQQAIHDALLQREGGISMAYCTTMSWQRHNMCCEHRATRSYTPTCLCRVAYCPAS